MVGLDHSTPMTAALEEPGPRARVVHGLGATHMINLNRVNDDGQLYLSPEVYALEPFVKVSSEGLPKMPLVDEEASVPSSVFSNLTYWALDLIPNSFSIGSMSRTLENKREQEGRVRETFQRNRSLLPPIVSSVDVRNINHRYSYSLWDTSLDWYGSYMLHWLDREVRYIPRGSETEKTFHHTTLVGAPC